MTIEYNSKDSLHHLQHKISVSCAKNYASIVPIINFKIVPHFWRIFLWTRNNTIVNSEECDSQREADNQLLFAMTKDVSDYKLKLLLISPVAVQVML